MQNSQISLKQHAFLYKIRSKNVFNKIILPDYTKMHANITKIDLLDFLEILK